MRIFPETSDQTIQQPPLAAAGRVRDMGPRGYRDPLRATIPLGCGAYSWADSPYGTATSEALGAANPAFNYAMPPFALDPFPVMPSPRIDYNVDWGVGPPSGGWPGTPPLAAAPHIGGPGMRLLGGLPAVAPAFGAGVGGGPGGPGGFGGAGPGGGGGAMPVPPGRRFLNFWMINRNIFLAWNRMVGGGGYSGNLPTIYYAKTKQNWVKVDGNGSYVPCNPAVERDVSTEVDTTITFDVYLPRWGTTLDPNVEAGRVIPYYIDVNGDKIAAFQYLDGTIAKSVQIWLGAPGDIATDKPGWAISTNWNPGAFPAAYRAADNDYGTIGATGGEWWHGKAGNNHPDHQLEHCHALTQSCEYVKTGSGTPGQLAQYGTGWTGLASWTQADNDLRVVHTGPYPTGPVPKTDTDNRPPYTVTLFIVRDDNSAPAP